MGHQKVMFQSHTLLVVLSAIFVVKTDLAAPLCLVSTPDSNNIVWYFGFRVDFWVESKKLVASRVGSETIYFHGVVS
jgi:hypothetical protein